MLGEKVRDFQHRDDGVFFRRSMSMQPNRISTGVTGVVAANLLTLVVLPLLVLAPNLSPAEEPAGSETTAEDVDQNGDVPIVTSTQSDASEIEVPDGEIAPPEGYEVISIKGRAVSGIETDVPESVTQFDAEAIAKLGAGNIADLAKVTPNVEIRVAGATAATFFIRGVGLSDFSANAAGAVAIYKDDVVMNSPAIQLGSLFDLKTVEIIRGPAGIGSHRNASAGAIKIYSNKPTAEYAARIKQTLGSFWSDDARDAFIRDTEGFVNLPLIEETLAMRVAFRVREQDPYMTNGCGDAPEIADRRNRPPRTSQRENLSQVCGEGLVIPRAKSPVPVGLPTKVGNKSDWAARGAFRLQPPGTDMDWLLSFHGSRLDQDSTLGQFTGVGDSGNILGSSSVAGYQEPDQAAEELRLKLKFGGVDTIEEFFALPPAELTAAQDKQQKLQAKNLASGRPLDREPYRGDYNRVGKTTLDIWGGHLRGEFSLGPIDVTTITAYEAYERFRDSDRDFTPDSLFEAVSTDDAKQFAQELNFSGELFDAAVRWNLGGAYLEEELHGKVANIEVQPGAVTDPFRIRTQIFTFDYIQNTSAFMTFAGLKWTFLEDFDLDVGARLNVEKKDFTLGRVSIAGFAERSDSKQWSEPTGRIGLTYHLNDRIDLHATFTRGYKAGQFNSNNISFEAADPEFIDSFEWRVNLNAFDRRLLVQAGFFYYKYKDYQVFIFTDEPGAFNTPSLVIR
ncbi:MAG: TonB-dependent receptor, partial [Deltaproteobacteria bacterium]|nr:TonB-dependent receptor [Deltaproteobacteria bacterium]